MRRSSQGPSQKTASDLVPGADISTMCLASPMEIHLVLDRAAPLRAQLERELREAIRSGRLRAGGEGPQPPARGRARRVTWSRRRGVLAARRRGLSGRPPGGRDSDRGRPRPAAARHARGAARDSGIRYDLRSGIPDLSFFPRREWQSATATALRELPDAAFTYGSRRGLRQLRIALSDYLGRVRAVVADPERMFISAGAVHGMSILWLTLRQRGAQRIAVEDPTWPVIPETIVQVGLEAVPIPVDENGLERRRVGGLDVDAVVLSPAHQYPTGTVLAPADGPS